MKILQINTSVNSGSTGRIAEDIGRLLISGGNESYIAFGRGAGTSASAKINIGNKFDFYAHVLKTRLTDRHGFGSLLATKALINKIDKINPDIIHLHNLHGYFINVRILFDYLKEIEKPVVWTLHDCWPFTGHCSHFERVKCKRWQEECNCCPNKRGYPASWLIDNSRKNYYDKKRLFNGLEKMVIVTPSLWLAGHVKKSFLSEYEVKVINNGVDLSVFRPVDAGAIRGKYRLPEKYILGVANVWSQRKGLQDFIELGKILPSDVGIVLVGLDKKQISALPAGMNGISRTENIEDLAALYSGAIAFVNPTYVDNFPAVNLEALACGTPVVTYNTGGSPEAIDSETGFIVEKGNIKGIEKAVKKIIENGKEHYIGKCRQRAEKYYDVKIMCNKYIELYNELIDKY